MTVECVRNIPVDRIASDVMSKQQVRVFLWAVPRSISTAFFRAMMNKTNCKVSLSVSDVKDRLRGFTLGRPGWDLQRGAVVPSQCRGSGLQNLTP